MILLAFTDYSRVLHPHGDFDFRFFNWSIASWRELITGGVGGLRGTFFGVLGWTLAWAVIATATNYILGILIAMLINTKGIKGKAVFRTCLVVSIAIPQFITLLILRTFLDDFGVFNNILQQAGIVSSRVQFLTSPWGARITVIVANLWIGIPFTMLIATGILLNIPEELYEAAKIDGAGPLRLFWKITFPYVLFVTTPYLITQFIGNINNFNVIFLLTGGGPDNINYRGAGHTDLLITWLYSMTLNQRNYSIASVIGIIVFVLSATFSLIFYALSSANKREGEFA